MVDKKIDNTEIDAILAAFSESRDIKVSPKAQSRTFKSLMIFANIYVFVFLIIYFFLQGNLLKAVDGNLMSEDFFAIFSGRGQIMFWLLVFMNLGVYFDFGFKIICLISFVYLLNATIDIALFFPDFINFSDRPYFLAFLLTRPLLIVTVAWLGLSHKSSIGDD